MLHSSLQNSCSEEVVIQAAQHVLSRKISFVYPQQAAIADVQIDISPVFLYGSGPRAQFIKASSTAELNETWQSLREQQQFPCFIRSGTNNGAGHYRLLYFCDRQKAWIMYSSNTNHYIFANAAGQLTQMAQQDLVVASGTWGSGLGEYSILLHKIDPDTIKRMANFIYDSRVHGDAKALECLASVTSAAEFYPQLCRSTPARTNFFQALYNKAPLTETYLNLDTAAIGLSVLALILAVSMQSWLMLLLAASILAVQGFYHLQQPSANLSP